MNARIKHTNDHLIWMTAALQLHDGIKK